MKTIYFLFVVCCMVSVSGGAGSALVKFRGYAGTCEFKDIGYKAGGGKVTIQRVTAPVAQLQKNILNSIAGKSAMSANLLMHSTNAVKAFEVFSSAGKKFVEAFAKLAPKLASSLGVFGAMLGFVADAAKPTAQQIIDSTNKALSQFAEEVNLRLDEMKGYVDEKTIEVEKTSFKAEFKRMQNLWLFCINEQNKDDILDCQKDAVKFITATTKFLLFDDERNAEINLGEFDIKRLEVSLLMFRDFTTLYINALESLGGSHELYKNESTYHKTKFEFYIGKLVEDVKKFKAYAKWAVCQIKKVHMTDNCMTTFHCTADEIYEGKPATIKVHTATNIQCTCNFDKTLVGSIKCKSRLYYRRDGKLLLSPWYMIFTSTKDDNVLMYESKKLLTRKSDAYRSELKKVIQTYWDNQVLDLVDTWDEIIERGEKRLAGESIKRHKNKKVQDYTMKTEPYSDKFNDRFTQVMEYIKEDLS